MTLRQLLWMSAERKRVMGELAAWQSLAIPGLLFCEKPPSIAELNPYGDGRPAEKSEALKRVDELRSRLSLRAMAHGGNVPEELTPDAEAALRIMGRLKQEQKVNDARTQEAVRRIIERGRAK